MSWRRLMITSLGSIFYVLVGYPMCAIVLGRLFGRERRPPAGAPLPGITVVVAAYNEEAVIRARIENLLASEYPPDRLSIVVAADGSDDQTAEIARSFRHPGVLVLADGPRRGKAAAINRALVEVTSEIVVFSDANNTYEADALTRLVVPFSHPRVGAVTGAKHVLDSGGETGTGESLYWRYESLLKTAESKLGSCVGVNGEILAVRADLLDRLPEDTINDDSYIAMRVLRAGFDVVYQPDAVSWEAPSGTADDDRLRRERIVAGRIQTMTRARHTVPWDRPLVAWQLVSHKLMRPLIPVLALVAMLSTLASLGTAARKRAGFGLPMTALAGQLAVYGAAWVGRRSSRPGKVSRTAAYLVDSNRASLSGTVGYLRGRQDVLWVKAQRAADQPQSQAR